MGSLSRMCEAERFIDQFGEDFKREEATGTVNIGETEYQVKGIALEYDDMDCRIDKCLVLGDKDSDELDLELGIYTVYYCDSMGDMDSIVEYLHRELPHLDEATIRERMEKVWNPEK